MKRKEVLPKWIRFFAWIHLLLLITPIIFAIGLIGEASFSMYGLSYSGSSLQPVAIWISVMATLAGVVAYGILWGKSWAIKIGIPYGYLAITTCVAAIIIRIRAGGFYIILDPFLLILFIISLKNNSNRWMNFDSDENETEISNKSSEPT